MGKSRMELPPVSAVLDYDLAREDCRLQRNTPLVEGVQLELVIPPEHWDLETLLLTAGDPDQCAGQQHGERLLRCQSLIPGDWDEHDLFFLGTQWVCANKASGKAETWIPRLAKIQDSPRWEMYRWCFQMLGWWPRAAIVKIVQPGAR